MSHEASHGPIHGRMDTHNARYAARFGILPENIAHTALNPDWFVEKIETPWQREIGPGVSLSAEMLPLTGENFTNVYDICISPESKASLKLLSFDTPRKPTHIFRDSPELIALANASFFYIIDDTDAIARQGPKDGTLNWCMRDGKILGLPSADRPALFEIDGKLSGRNVRAQGELKVNGRTIAWEGGQRIMHAPKEAWGSLYNPNVATVFNSACTAITKEDENPHALRMLEKETYYTPEHQDVYALAVSADENGVLRVEEVRKGGGMGLFDGHFILHVPEYIYSELGIEKGAVITPTMLDGIEIAKVNSALTIGPSVSDYRKQGDKRPIDEDKSFGQPPPFAEHRRYARTIVLKDTKGIHLRIYDAVPVSSHFNGISPREIATHLPEETEWAFFCDGGQSTILGTRTEGEEIEFFGNNHYATQKLLANRALLNREPAPEGSRLLGRKRSLPSAIGIYLEN